MAKLFYFFISLFLFSCASKIDVQYYNLIATAKNDEQNYMPNLSLSLDDLVLAEHLKQDNLIIKISDIEYSQQIDKAWAQEIETNIIHVIAQNIKILTKSQNIFTRDFSYHLGKIKLKINIDEFAGILGQKASIKGSFIITKNNENKINSFYFEVQTDENLESLVLAKSKLLELLSKEILKDL